MIKVIEANNTYYERWDKFIQTSINGTLFNTRKFLSYHGNKFSGGEKFLTIFKNDTLIGQLTIYISEVDGKKICYSPYGASYGGIILQRQPTYSEGRDIVVALIEYLKENKVSEFIVTPPISCCSNVSLDTFYFNMLEQGFKIVNQDISSVVQFQNDSIEKCIMSKTRNHIKFAEKNGIRCEVKTKKIDDFWKVLELNHRKLNTKPTHSYCEFLKLINEIPKKIYIDVAYKNNIPVAGIAYFVINDLVNSSFYLCQDPEYQNYEALSLLIINGLKCSQNDGYKYFDFGTSTSKMIARPNLFLFKEQFSKSGYFRTTYIWRNNNT